MRKKTDWVAENSDFCCRVALVVAVVAAVVVVVIVVAVVVAVVVFCVKKRVGSPKVPQARPKAAHPRNKVTFLDPFLELMG